jgi:hypothetical protein
MPTPNGAVKLGSDAYLFASQTQTTDCIIDAHGGYTFECRTFTVPAGLTLIFYSDHGQAVTDPGQGALRLAKYQDLVGGIETITAGNPCKNYLLSKSWGHHTFAPGTTDAQGQPMAITYGDASTATQTLDADRTARVDRYNKASKAQLTTGTMAGLPPTASLITVRNRWDIIAGVPLKDLLLQATQQMPTLTRFHCLFCRTPMLPSIVATMLDQTSLAQSANPLGRLPR